MKKLFNHLVVGICIVSCFSACTDSQSLFVDESMNCDEKNLGLTNEEIISISYDDHSEIPQEEVFAKISDFLELETKNAKTRMPSNLQFVVRNKEYLKERDDGTTSTRAMNQIPDSIPVYEVLINSNGNNYYAFVSADRRSPGVFAIFDNFPIDDAKIAEGLNHPNMKAALTLSKMQLICDIENIKQIRSEFREATIEKICNKLGISRNEYSFEKIKSYLNLDSGTSTRNSGGVEMPQEQIVLQKEPMGKILWEQNVPYNGACPEGTILINLGAGISFTQQGNVPAGCVTIACMNIEACLERTPIGGIPMDWSYYKDAKTLFKASAGQSGGTPATLLERAQKAIRYIYDELDSSPVYEYYNGTRFVSATQSSLGRYYIQKNFNYEKSQTFDPDVVLSSLNAGKPVYLDGNVYGTATTDPTKYVYEGHAFVIDGYIICQKAATAYQIQLKTRANIVQYYDMYWHLSLGWGETAGYFKLDSDATCTPEFYDKYGRYNLIRLKDMHIISHISKK